MSLVAKYVRRNEDEEESPVEAKTEVKESEEARNKKRSAETEVEAPQPKKAKARPNVDDELELPDVFKTNVPVAGTSNAMEVDKSTIISTPKNTLVPRQLKYVPLHYPLSFVVKY